MKKEEDRADSRASDESKYGFGSSKNVVISIVAAKIMPKDPNRQRVNLGKNA